MNKRASPFAPDEDQGPWVSLGNGRYKSQSTGRLKYNPEENPEYKADMHRRALELAKKTQGQAN